MAEKERKKSGACVGTATPADFIAVSHYGQLLYRELRCSWVHELTIGELSTRPFSSDPRYTEPHYENWIERGSGPSPTRRRPVFPRAFLLATLADAINGFEQGASRTISAPDEPLNWDSRNTYCVS